MSKTGPDGSIRVNPLLSRLLSHDIDMQLFMGYIGPSDGDGTIRLYPSIEFLTSYLEIPRAAIVDAAPAPPNVLPHGGTSIWVKRNADVVLHGDTVTTVSVAALRTRAGQVAAPTKNSAAHVRVTQGRLRMSASAQRLVSRMCETCSSCSSICTSNCCAVCQA